ncbi:MAG: hypothetical protein MN733_01165 [Nitrososphaera sp.]|nr:hypothetical protein [Nitrososphaera sp.]
MADPINKTHVTTAALIGAAAVLGTTFLLQEKSPGARISDIARQNGSIVAVVAGKEGQLVITDPQEGKTLTSCNQRECPTEVKVSELGEPMLIDRKTGEPIRGAKASKIYHWSWKGSHCQGTWSSGTHTVNCCQSISCW